MIPKLHPQIGGNLTEYDIPKELVDTYYPFFQAISESFTEFEAVRHEKKEVVNHERLLDSIENIIFQIDCNNRFTYVNKAIERISSYKAEEIIGKHYKVLYGIVDFPRSKTISIFNIKTTGHLEKVIPIKVNGDRKWFRIQVHPIMEENVCIGATGSMVDVTYLKTTEIELIKASKAKSDFLSTMSHEIRTPLNAVIGMTNVLKMQEYLPEQEEGLNALKFSSEHLLGLINDILDYNKIEAGKITFSEVSFNLHEMLSGLQKTFSFTANEKRVSFKVKQNFSLGSYVVADRTRLFQVLTNLIGNAIKFTEKGSVQLDIEKVAETEDSIQLIFKVCDTGIGIPQEKLGVIFEQFSQVDTSLNRSLSGTGLGLAISSRLLMMQGSKLEVASVEGEGSTFFFSFAFKKGDKFEKVAAGEDIIISDPFNDLENPIEILMAEDNVMNIVLIKRFFKLWNIKLDVANNGQEAIDKIKERDYDIVLMDIQMPILDGFSATRQIRALEGKRFQEVPILALTASVDVQYRSRASNIGMNDYLTKPFNPMEFKKKILFYYNARKRY